MDSNKKVSVLIPCRNEVKNIEACIRNVFGFEKPEGDFEVMIVDGMSDDGTRDILLKLQEQYPTLVILDNPERTVPHAMNLGITQAKGEYIVRTDVRCLHPKNYLKDLIKLSEETGADNVGGVLIPLGNTYVQQCVAAAYRSRITMGGALRDRGDFAGETDAVYGGCFRRSRLIEVGMYDESMVRNQDDELSFRLRKSGGKIIQSGRIKIQYFPRNKFRQLFKQFMQYGYWKVAIMKKHPAQLSLRHFVPAVLVAGFALLGVTAVLNKFVLGAFFLYAGGYVSLILLESLRLTFFEKMKLLPGVMLAIVSIHFGFGAGFITALISNAVRIKPKVVESLSR
ncbi:MAG: glycosyltransferase family 2 protein [Nitrospirae bacterium]|nr:glycosyltransferase family 2 protein [Nitrospirota bacterium]